MTNQILQEDMRYIFDSLESSQKEKFRDSCIVITGCAGFLGFYFLHFLSMYAKTLGVAKIVGLDNFMLGMPKWLDELVQQTNDQLLEIHTFNVISDDIATIDSAKNATFIIHGASIASPTFYRKYPIETLDANIWGLRNLLEFYKERKIKGLLFFSSSEIYGDPDSSNIPTSEEYRGNVSCIGPRACYDESKRFGETMCYLFALKYKMPLTIARPFNNYGPGMSINDKRVVADFAKAIIEKRDIEILSNGSPTRTFCYVADAISGYLKVLVYGEFEYFNIGIDKGEISINELAKIYIAKGEKLFSHQYSIHFATSDDKDYLTHNPNRRSPDISKARKLLGYKPNIFVEDGVERFLRFLSIQSNKEL